MASFEIRRRNGDTYTVLVDDSDLERVLAAGRWSVAIRTTSGGTKRVYVEHRVNWKLEFLHRFIAGPHGEAIDHINGNGLDNRRENLRPCSRRENSSNSRRPTNNTSGVKGVSWDKRKNRWHAYVVKAGRRVYSGYFSDLRAAEAAVVAARQKLHGEFANHGEPAARTLLPNTED